MRVAYTTILSAALAASALAFPFRGANQKRDEALEIVTECTTVLVTQYVTAGPSPSSSPEPVQVNNDDVPAPAEEYTKYHTKSRRPRPTVYPSPSQAPETTPPPPAVVTPPIETPIPTSTPSTTLKPVTVSSVAPAPTTPSVSTSGAPAPDSGSFEAEVLAAHNDKRALHGVPALTYDKALADYAAGVCSSCRFEHSNGPHGENLAAGYSSPSAAIQAWYDEEKLYSYSSGGFSSETGHFTQMVWKSATKLGCAVKACNGANGTPGTFLTCNYDTGNVIGQFQANVLPPK
ncbi:PR-1-like protein [Tuber magnatum]|uniref:PR-1-like protein n=1 Tax=Tuber magnatum TaxID=42249 RepID=A0A317SGS8_9PEZI|nr:PR-1-like protein [Tuber magnatum]